MELRENSTSIGKYAYKNSVIKEITLNSSIKEIGKEAFANCSKLTSITIPAGVTRIGKEAFAGCKNLTSIYYLGDIASWCRITFDDPGSNPLQGYNADLYIDNAFVNEIVLPDTVTKINAYAFRNWQGRKVVIPDSVTHIGASAFQFCFNLTDLTIGNGVEEIGKYAFGSCAMRSVAIGPCIKSIGADAFSGCNKLISVIISEAATNVYIGDRAFS